MSDYIWRTNNNSAIYVDSDTGDDIIGDGTKTNPYQTLGKAYRGRSSVPSTIICRGKFSEDMADGNHSCLILGDYRGGAIFDGLNLYTIYGFTLTNVIAINCIPGTYNTNVFIGPVYIAGVGRAGNSYDVGNTNPHYLYGLAGSGGIVGLSGHYFGMIGGIGSKNCIFNPICNDNYKLWFFGYNEPEQWCIHGVKKADRIVSRLPNQGLNGFKKSIFTDCAFYINDHLTFTDCFFGVDCTWWNSTGTEQIILQGDTSEDRIEFLKNKMTELGTTSTNCSFINCTFSDKTAYEIFNNPDFGDFSIKIDSGVPDEIGAFGKGLNIPIMENSTGIPGTWDEKTAEGLIKVKDNDIYLDEESDAKSGQILSKIIILDTSKMTLKGLVSILASKFSDKAVQFYDRTIFEGTYNVGDVLPTNSKFKVLKGPIIYYDVMYYTGDIITSQTEEYAIETAFDTPSDAQVAKLKTCNVANAVFIRSSSAVYSYVETNTSLNLDPTLTYLNVSTVSIPVEHLIVGRYTLLPNESITGITSYTATSNGILGIMFNNTKAIDSEWIPLQTLGESWVSKIDNQFERDDEEIVKASGNPKSYKTAIAFNFKRLIVNKYLQFKIEVHK